jgi:hypothetical protein
MNNVETTVGKSAIPRNYQELPTLYFIAMDDWIDKLGEKSFCLYLKLWTMVDRTDKENECIKTRTSKLVKKLNMVKSTYLRLLRPLYEYGLIDLVEYEDSKNKGSKPVNVIVHQYPQNKFELAVQPLEKCRDWEQRTDEKYNFTKKGGRPKKDAPVDAGQLEESTVEPIQEEVAEELAPTKEEVQEAVQEDVQAVEEVEVVEETVEFKGNVNPVVTEEYAYLEKAMEENGADLEVVKNWVNKVSDTVYYTKICYVFKQLATYPEPIKKTSVFIVNTLDKAPTVYKPFTELFNDKKEIEEGTQSYTPKVPFFNWLDA